MTVFFRSYFSLLSACDVIIAKNSKKFVLPTSNISLCIFRKLNLVQIISVKQFTVLPCRQLGAVRKEFKRTLLVS